MSEWWRGFFEGPVLDLWRAVAPDEEAQTQIDVLVDRCALAAGDRVLDVPCGNGRHLRALARHGIRATGVDLSREFVSEAARLSAGSPVDVHRREMRDLRWRDTFDAALCLGNSFGYLDDAGNRAFLAAVATALRPTGRLVIHTAALAESWFAGGPAASVHEVAGLRVETAAAYDPDTSTLRVSYAFADGTRRQADYRVYTMRDLQTILAENGFTGIRVSRNPSGDPFKNGNEEAWITATLRG